MGEMRYIISDASKKIDVEPHVLRYWEEELNLEINRNEMGHRYYTEENIRVCKTIKELKEQGFQLKAIKLLLPDIVKGEGLDIQSVLHMKEELNDRVESMYFNETNQKGNKTTFGSDETKDQKDKYNKDNSVVKSNQTSITGRKLKDDTEIETGDKMQQFRMILSDIVLNALRENNESLVDTVSSNVSNKVIKEMDYQFRVKEEKEEERFKRFDEAMREYQKVRQESAASTAKERREIRKREKKIKKLAKKNIETESLYYNE